MCFARKTIEFEPKLAISGQNKNWPKFPKGTILGSNIGYGQKCQKLTWVDFHEFLLDFGGLKCKLGPNGPQNPILHKNS